MAAPSATALRELTTLDFTFALASWLPTVLAADQVTPAPASLTTVRPILDPGRYACGYVRFAAAVNALDTITTVTAQEVWTAVAAGPVANAWQWIRTANAANDVAAFVAAVNANVNGLVWAINIGGNAVAIIGKLQSTVVTLAESTAGVRTVAGSSIAPAGSADKALVEGTYPVTAADVIAMAAGEEIVLGAFPAATAPRKLAFRLETAAGIERLTNTMSCIARVDTAGFYAVCMADVGGVAQNTDIVRWAFII